MIRQLKRVLAWGDVAFFAAFMAVVVHHAHWNLRSWVGLVLAAAGFVLWITARRQLGKSFTIRAQARVLVTSGLYSKLRHPIYLFGFFAYLGLFLIWGKWVLLACFVAVYSIEIVRLKKEERVLEQTFGDEYRRYRAQTWI